MTFCQTESNCIRPSVIPYLSFLSFSLIPYLCESKVRLKAAEMAAISVYVMSTSLYRQSTFGKPILLPSKVSFNTLKSPPQVTFKRSPQLTISIPDKHCTRASAVAEETSSSTATELVEASSEGARKLYVGNIPRTVDNDELRLIVEEHGAVEKAEVMYDKYSGRSRRFGFVTMKSVEDANVAIEKLNGIEIKGRQLKVNITEKPLESVDLSILQAEDSQFIDSPHKVYVGNVAKSVTTDMLKNFFSAKGQVLSAKVSRVPGTSQSSGFGFVSFSSAEDVDAAISSLNNSVLEGQTIRVNKA